MEQLVLMSVRIHLLRRVLQLLHHILKILLLVLYQDVGFKMKSLVMVGDLQEILAMLQVLMVEPQVLMLG